MQKITIIGAGAWGTALAQTAATAGRDVTIWAREEDVATAINEHNENTVFLPGIKLNENIKATNDMAEALLNAQAVLIVTPAQHLRSTATEIAKLLPTDIPVILCSKGIELDTGMLMTTIMEEVMPENPCAVLSGPTFAKDVAMGMPTATTLACTNKDLAQTLAEALSCKFFRIYVSDDPIGAEIGGAIKNVIAIACGIVTGRKLGDSARAALMTRGLAEMGRLAASIGANKETLMGMCGIGDLSLTCSSMLSRNYSLGVMMGEGQSLKEIIAARNSVTEGIPTAQAVQDIAQKMAIDMPLCAAVNNMVNHDVSIDETIEALLSRPTGEE